MPERDNEQVLIDVAPAGKDPLHEKLFGERYPEIRRYKGHSAKWSYQPMPVVRGALIASCPVYSDQTLAALFTWFAHQLSGSTPPFDEPDLIGAGYDLAHAVRLKREIADAVSRRLGVPPALADAQAPRDPDERFRAALATVQQWQKEFRRTHHTPDDSPIAALMELVLTMVEDKRR